MIFPFKLFSKQETNHKLLFTTAILGIMVCSIMAYYAGYISGQVAQQKIYIEEINLKP